MGHKYVTRGEKERAYGELAGDLLDYIEMCADKHIAPLKYDAQIFRTRKIQIDKRRLR